jgi:hypothetical protein
MLKRDDFVFTIGYDGPAAVVDSQARRRFGGLSTAGLAEKGLFRAAWASAVHADSAAEKSLVVEKYNAASGSAFPPDADLGKLFGVFPHIEAKRAVVL